MSTKHTATVQNHTFKRTSEGRVYTHHIAAVHSLSADRAATEKSARSTYEMNLKFHQKMAAGGTYHSTYGNGAAWSKEITADEQASSQAILTAGIEGAVAESLARFDRQERLMIGADEYVTDAGWASRRDLAEKTAAKAAKYARRAIITEAKIV